MCDLREGFKLCTCSSDLNWDDIDWVLKRINTDLPIYHRKGRAAISSFTTKQETQKQYILGELNNRNCFDFEYIPEKDDTLKLKGSNDKWFSFRYTDKWEVDKSTSLAGWKTQLELLQKGKIN